MKIRSIMALFIFVDTSYSLYLINNDFKLETELIKSRSKILQLFITFSSVCVVSQTEEIKEIFTEISRSEFKTLMIFENLTKTLQGQCSVVVMEEMTISEKCMILANDKLKSPLYIVNYSTSHNLESLGRCLANSLSPEVVAISLADSSVWELSSVYSPPRHFSSSSVAEVIQHRAGLSTPDLGGRVLTAASLNIPPFTIFNRMNKSENYDGIAIEIAKEMAKKLNFTIEYHVYKDWGYLHTNGTFEGGMGQAMAEGAAELAIGYIWEMLMYFSVVNFVASSFDKNEISFLVRRPEQMDFQWQMFSTIFQFDMWLAILTAFALVLAAYYALNFHFPDWLGSFLTMFGYLTMSSSHSRTDDGRSRPLLTSWSVFSLLLTSCLSSGIVSRLTLPLYSPRVDTIQQLVEDKFYWTEQNFVQSREYQRRRILSHFESPWYPKFMKQFKYMESEEIRNKLESDEKITLPVHVYSNRIIVTRSAGIIGHRALRKFRKMKEYVGGFHVTFGVRKHSPYSEPLTKVIYSFIEAGLLKGCTNNVISRWPQYDTRHLTLENDIQTYSEPQALRLYKTQPVFYMLLSGLGLGLLVFLVEITW